MVSGSPNLSCPSLPILKVQQRNELRKPLLDFLSQVDDKSVLGPSELECQGLLPTIFHDVLRASFALALAEYATPHSSELCYRDDDYGVLPCPLEGSLDENV